MGYELVWKSYFRHRTNDIAFLSFSSISSANQISPTHDTSFSVVKQWIFLVSAFNFQTGRLRAEAEFCSSNIKKTPSRSFSRVLCLFYTGVCSCTTRAEPKIPFGRVFGMPNPSFQPTKNATFRNITFFRFQKGTSTVEFRGFHSMYNCIEQ